MLWLTGLLGVVVVGAVSFFEFSGTDSEEEEDAGFDDFIDENGHGDLTSTLQSLNPLPPDGASGDGYHYDFAALNELDQNGGQSGHGKFELDDQPAPDTSTAADWVAAQPLDEIMSFDPSSEDLVLVWDDTTGDEPDVTLFQNPDNPELMEIRIGESVMAQVPADTNLTSDNIATIPLSAAQAIGWTET